MLGAMPTRALARPVIVLLTSGLLPAWRRQNPDFEVPGPSPMVTHPPARSFVPQQARAMKRAKVVAAAGAAGALALVWFLLR
jgi:hypothetical protein